MRDDLDKEYRRELAEELRERNTDPTQRTDARAAITALDRSVRKSIERADGIAAVTGVPGGAAAAVRGEAAESLAGGTAAIAADGERRRDTAVERSRARQERLNERRRKVDSMWLDRF